MPVNKTEKVACRVSKETLRGPIEKPKVAFFEFADCEGCQLCALDLTPEQLLDLLSVIDIVEFREAMTDTANRYDIAIVEGSITRDSDIERLQDIRDRSDIVVAFGSCAHIAGFNAIKNFQTKAEYTQAAYPQDPNKYETTTAKAIGEIIQVDAVIPGCPIDTDEFLRVVKNLALGKRPGIPDYPVCVECKNNGNTCVYEKGMICLGPITRAGCGARCPSNGGYCFGCRGLVSQPNIKWMKDVMAKHGFSPQEIEDAFKICLGRSEEVFNNGQ